MPNGEWSHLCQNIMQGCVTIHILYIQNCSISYKLLHDGTGRLLDEVLSGFCCSLYQSHSLSMHTKIIVSINVLVLPEVCKSALK